MNSSPPRIPLPDAPRVLITRLSAIGDCIHTTPLLAALRRRWPQAHLGWVTRGGPASLLQNHADLNELIVVPKAWTRQWSDLAALRRKLRATRWDVVIDPQSLTKSALLGWLTGCSQRIGFAAPLGRELSLWLNRTRVLARQQHMVDRYLELLRPLGIAGGPVEFRLGPYSDAARRVQAELAERHLTAGAFVVMNPGAGWPSKIWPARRYGAVARYLGQAEGLPSLVVWSGDVERQAAIEIVESSGGAALMASETTLPELAEWCRVARLFVGSDTGPMHLAAALQTPCVALFGPTDPRICGPYGPRHRSVQSMFKRPRRRLAKGNEAMQAIDVPQVTAACSELLADAQSHSHRAA